MLNPSARVGRAESQQKPAGDESSEVIRAATRLTMPGADKKPAEQLIC
ncbi:MAG: hypothetical protein V4446_01450 [Pseudomonadota bacterium]